MALPFLIFSRVVSQRQCRFHQSRFCPPLQRLRRQLISLNARVVAWVVSLTLALAYWELSTLGVLIEILPTAGWWPGHSSHGTKRLSNEKEVFSSSVKRSAACHSFSIR